MRRLLNVVVGVMVAGALVGAQAKSPEIKKVKQEVTFSDDVKVGSTLLKSGRYQVSSSATGTELTFRRMIRDVAYPGVWVFDMEQQPVVAKCTVTALAAKNKGTSLDMPDDGAGGRTLKALTLDGTNLTFTIAQ